MGTVPVWHMLLISAGMAVVIALGKIVISVLSAFAVVFFRFPFRRTAFWIIFVTLMLPVEVRIIPTYAVMSDLHMINTFSGLTDSADRFSYRDTAVSSDLCGDP